MVDEHVSTALSDSAVLILVQVGAALAVAAPAVLVVGACAAWVPVAGTLVSAFVVLRLAGARRPGWLTRPRVRRLSLHSGLAHAVLGALAYLAAVVAAPEAFELEPGAALLLAPLLGAGIGLVALVVTLCGGDGAAASLGTWPDERLPPGPR